MVRLSESARWWRRTKTPTTSSLWRVAALVLVGSMAFPGDSAAQPTEPIAVVQAMHEAWNAYDAAGLLAAFAPDAVVTTPLAGSTPRDLAAVVLDIDPFMNRRLEAGDYQASNGTVTWRYTRPSDDVQALGIEPPSGTGEALVDGGKIRSYSLRDDPAWQAQLDAAQAAIFRGVAPPTSESTGPPARLATTLHRDGQWDLYALNLDGTGLTRLTTSPEREVRPIWSPDGAQVAFSVGRPMGPGVRLGTDGLYVVRSDGSGLRPVAAGKLYAWSWSPDSSLLTYSTGEGTASASARLTCSYDKDTLHVVDVASGNELAVGPNTTSMWLGRAGERLWRQNDQWQVVAIGTDVVRPLAVPSEWLPFTVSPSGDYLVWLDFKSDEFHLMNLQGEQLRPLGVRTLPLRMVFADYVGCTWPREVIRAWAPDGAHLVVLAADQTEAAGIMGIDTRPPLGVPEVDGPGPPAGASWDPLNAPLDHLALGVVDLAGGAARVARVPYGTLLADFPGVFRQGARSGRGVRESNLGIASVNWSADGTKLLYAVAGEAGENSWRFFWYQPADGSRGEILSGLAPGSKAYLACCGR